jgi:hypothetical protein
VRLRANIAVTLPGVGDLAEGDEIDVTPEQWAVACRISNVHDLLKFGHVEELVNAAPTKKAKRKRKVTRRETLDLASDDDKTPPRGLTDGGIS